MEFSDSFWAFIDDNLHCDPNSLRLKYHSSDSLDFDVQFAICQIECRKKCSHKLPSFCSNKRVIFPTTLSSEQCTSEILARFHASLLPNGCYLLDMTSGLCIDGIHASAKCNHVTAIDINPIVTESVRYNLKVLGVDNLEVINQDSIDYLSNSAQKWDVIFIDPARRAESNKRTFAFEDCEPNIIEHFDLIKQHCHSLIIKASPMLDITKVINSVDQITDIWVLSVRNECKEVLIKCDFVNSSDEISVHAIDFDKDANMNVFSFAWNEAIDSEVSYVENIDEIGQNWLYEPNSSLMKCACWNALVGKYPRLKKMHQNTHLFVSSEFYHDFPGRIHRVADVYNPKSKELKQLKGEYFNVVLRNYHMSIDIVKKQFKIKDGGNRFIYCFKYGKEKSAILLTE